MPPSPENGAHKLVKLSKNALRASGDKVKLLVKDEEEAGQGETVRDVSGYTYRVSEFMREEFQEWQLAYGVYFGITAFTGALVQDPGAVLLIAPVPYVAMKAARCLKAYLLGSAS